MLAGITVGPLQDAIGTGSAWPTANAAPLGSRTLADGSGKQA
jgi:hypothetical protein